jgi:prepilin-type N-terminal cleavage/methylation domain-containing protein
VVNLKKLIKNRKGVSLIELMLVISIIGIISLIVTPKFITSRNTTTKTVCEFNRSELKKSYEIFLLKNGLVGDNINFNNFLTEYNQNICPDGGVITINDGEIYCDKHIDNVEVIDDGGVPYI